MSKATHKDIARAVATPVGKKFRTDVIMVDGTVVNLISAGVYRDLVQVYLSQEDGQLFFTTGKSIPSSIQHIHKATIPVTLAAE